MSLPFGIFALADFSTVFTGVIQGDRHVDAEFDAVNGGIVQTAVFRIVFRLCDFAGSGNLWQQRAIVGLNPVFASLERPFGGQNLIVIAHRISQRLLKSRGQELVNVVGFAQVFRLITDNLLINRTRNLKAALRADAAGGCL